MPGVTIRDRLLAAVRPRLARHGIALGKAPMFNRLDHALMRVLQGYDIDCVLDVGAHRGESVRFLRRMCGWKGPIVSFEPVHSDFVELVRAMEHDHAWRGIETALGATGGTATIRHFPKGSQFDSLLPLSDLGQRFFPVIASDIEHEPVVVQRLDAVIDDAPEVLPGDAALLKIDAQGSDLDILRGATKCMDRVASLQIELPVLAIYEGLPTLGSAIDEVTAYGFDLVGLFPIARDDDLRVLEFDGLFVRKP
jgi:FkbM family methyltransferase